MKSLKLFLLTMLINIVIFTVFFSTSFGAGACTMSSISSSDIAYVTWVCTADASDGSFPSTVTSSPTLRGWVYVVDVTPGTTTPTDGSGFTLTSSASGVDVMGGNASTMLGASPSRAIPQASGWINGTLTPVITGNSVNSAIFTIRATIWKQRN